jgi:6-phosphofructokinase 2
VVISGTLPPGVLPDIVPDLCGKLRAKGCEVVVDTSGPALYLLARGKGPQPDILRMNQEEADDLARRKLLSIEDSADFAQSLVRRGVARMVIVARGPEGSVLATDSGAGTPARPTCPSAARSAPATPSWAPSRCRSPRATSSPAPSSAASPPHRPPS